MLKNHLLKLIQKEFATTLKVIEAYPKDKLDYKPHEKSNSAKRLMMTFIFEMYLMNYGLGDEMNRELFKTYDPAGLDVIVSDFKQLSASIIQRVKSAPEEQFVKDVDFAGKKFPLCEYLEMMTHDQIHHRGQLTVYVRISGGLVPSIYGPSADDKNTNL